MLSESQKKLLQLLDNALHNQEKMAFSKEEWPEIYNEMKMQAVWGLPANSIDFQYLSQEDDLSYMKATGKNVKRFFSVMNVQQHCLSVLEGIPVVVLKGAAAAMYYPCP